MGVNTKVPSFISLCPYFIANGKREEDEQGAFTFSISTDVSL